jgi:hypothetical protein
MLQQRQIVVKGLGKQIDREYLVCTKYPITDFHSIAWMIISFSVTIHRTVLKGIGVVVIAYSY